MTIADKEIEAVLDRLFAVIGFYRDEFPTAAVVELQGIATALNTSQSSQAPAEDGLVEQVRRNLIPGLREMTEQACAADPFAPEGVKVSAETPANIAGTLEMLCDEILILRSRCDGMKTVDNIEAVAELQLAAFLAGRGSVTSMRHGTRAAKPCPSMDDFRRMARAALGEGKK